LVGPEDASALARMGLDTPRGIKERLLRRLVALALSRSSGCPDGAKI
jgi:hypothetical protein